MREMGRVPSENSLPNPQNLVGKGMKREKKLVGRGEKHSRNTHEWLGGPIEKKKSVRGSLVPRRRTVNKRF
jgi:hypothetical protein